VSPRATMDDMSTSRYDRWADEQVRDAGPLTPEQEAAYRGKLPNTLAGARMKSRAALDELVRAVIRSARTKRTRMLEDLVRVLPESNHSGEHDVRYELTPAHLDLYRELMGIEPYDDE
jgi:hypothetical protein